MAKKITGGVAVNGQVFYAGQEAELEAAAKGAKIDLTDARFAESLEGFGTKAAAADEDEAPARGARKSSK